MIQQQGSQRPTGVTALLAAHIMAELLTAPLSKTSAQMMNRGSLAALVHDI